MKRFSRFLITILMAGGFFLWLLQANPARATVLSSFTVNNLGDSAPGANSCPTASCTLRSAIEQADAAGGPWTITIPAGTINLTHGELRLSPKSAPGSTLNLNIKGAGSGLTIIDAGKKSRGFFLGKNNGPVTLQALSIRNALNSGGSGTPSNPAGNGGAIYNESDLTLTDVIVSDSVANQGGGIFTQFGVCCATTNKPILRLNNVSILRNTATSAVTGEGGGGLFNGHSLVADGVIISGNSAHQGGGFYNNTFSTTVSLNNFTISNNTSYNGSGGGIDNDLGVIGLSNGAITGNKTYCCDIDVAGGRHPAGGAGIYANASAEYGVTSMITIDNVTINLNIVKNTDINGNPIQGVGGFGGGIHNSQKMTITKSAIVGNQADYGAGIQNGNQVNQVNELVIINSTISTNTGPVSASLDTEGGGLRNMGGQATLINVTVTNNSAEVGGGVTSTGGALVLKNTIVAQNIGSYAYPLILNQPDCRGVITSGGYNLVGSLGLIPGGYYAPCTFNRTTGDQVSANPLLGPLTTTPPYLHPLNTNSPAIDTANISSAVCPATDERGVKRPQGRGCDIGAYEAATFVLNNHVYVPLVVR